MIVKKISEYGYEEAALGFSLSYNTSIERAKAILPKYAFGVPGEDKFLESMIMYLDVTAPRYWWQEADTYRVGSTKQSESTMHTLTKKLLTQENFQDEIDEDVLDALNEYIYAYKTASDTELKKEYFVKVKAHLPESFLQRRVWCLSYKTFRNIYRQRINHRLYLWPQFLLTVANSLNHPEFIVSTLDK